MTDLTAKLLWTVVGAPPPPHVASFEGERRHASGDNADRHKESWMKRGVVFFPGPGDRSEACSTVITLDFIDPSEAMSTLFAAMTQR